MFFLIMLISQIWAFNGAPQWSAYEPRTMKLEEGFSRVDSEYVSDQLAYSHEINQEYLWALDQNRADFTFGSISSDNFLYQGRLKLINQINKQWSFKYLVFEQQDFEIDQSQSWIGVNYRPIDSIAFGVYGTPSSDKGTIDYKISTTFYAFNGELTLYSVKTDLMKNSKSLDGSTYKIKPSSYGLSWLSGSVDEFLLFNYRIDPVSQLELNNSDILESKHSLTQLVFQQKFYSRIWRLKSEASKIFERSNQNWAQQQLYEIRLETEKNNLGIGLLWKKYLWHKNTGFLEHDNYLPYVYYNIRGDRLNHKLTYESTYHTSDQIGVIDVSNTDCKACFEHRLNYSITKDFNDNFSFRFKFTFDMDEFGTASTWEGGSGQFYLKF
ncbi:MAG: hypothetical protein MK008_03070 [Bdellovibrionales bacterium]|nr:hypothetical protein [Bdellovibrionales bacterium]